MSVFVSNVKITGGQVMSASTFLELLDTPAAYLGEAGQVVAVNATEDGLEFIAGGGGGGLAAVVDDTSPQLGGDLEVNGFGIISAAASGQDVVITPDSGTMRVVGPAGTSVISSENTDDLQLIGASGTVRVGSTGGATISTEAGNSIIIDSGNDLVLNGLTWPTADGANGETIVTDGSGNLSWGSGGGGGDFQPFRSNTTITVGTVGGEDYATLEEAVEYVMSRNLGSDAQGNGNTAKVTLQLSAGTFLTGGSLKIDNLNLSLEITGAGSANTILADDLQIRNCPDVKLDSLDLQGTLQNSGSGIICSWTNYDIILSGGIWQSYRNANTGFRGAVTAKYVSIENGTFYTWDTTTLVSGTQQDVITVGPGGNMAFEGNIVMDLTGRTSSPPPIRAYTGGTLTIDGSVTSSNGNTHTSLFNAINGGSIAVSGLVTKGNATDVAPYPVNQIQKDGSAVWNGDTPVSLSPTIYQVPGAYATINAAATAIAAEQPDFAIIELSANTTMTNHVSFDGSGGNGTIGYHGKVVIRNQGSSDTKWTIDGNGDSISAYKSTEIAFEDVTLTDMYIFASDSSTVTFKDVDSAHASGGTYPYPVILAEQSAEIRAAGTLELGRLEIIHSSRVYAENITINKTDDLTTHGVILNDAALLDTRWGIFCSQAGTADLIRVYDVCIVRAPDIAAASWVGDTIAAYDQAEVHVSGSITGTTNIAVTAKPAAIYN